MRYSQCSLQSLKSAILILDKFKYATNQYVALQDFDDDNFVPIKLLRNRALIVLHLKRS